MRAAAIGFAIAVALVAAAPVAARSWYVSAATGGPGNGSRAAPFDRLAAVERASRPGDRIVVLGAPRSVAPLDGGIELKPHQRLIGERARGRRAARLTNTTDRLDGDAVRLASGVTVRNLEISGTGRGGIYGENVRRATIAGNDVWGHNASCAPGFHIPPFTVPTTLAGVGIPIGQGLHNGWAGIMVDATRGRSRILVRANRVHDADCGDGIDVRASGAARVRATIAGNEVSDLRQGSTLESILAIGLQSQDHARLEAAVDRNRESGLGNDEDPGIGPAGADSEGVFVNPVGASRLRAAVSRNTYTHSPGRGGFSANGLEFVSMGDGAVGRLDVSESSFSGPPGDVIEQLALGTNARLRMSLDRVSASGSTGFAGSGVGDTVVIPGNNGDCVIAASGGAGNAVDLTVRHSELTDCANNGLTFGSAVANGSGPTAAMRLRVSDSSIRGNRDGNLRVGNVSGLRQLEVSVERTDLSNSHGIGSTVANFTAEELGSTARSTIDLGGGALGSSGGNCLGGGVLAAAVIGYDVTARGDWWGRPGGPGPGRTAAVGGTLDSRSALESAPAGC
jgi:Right handed beta helix region